MSPPPIDEFPRSEVEPAELEVLSSGHEDVYALWEIAGAVNSAVPNLPVARVLRLAQAVVFDLLERELLELSHGRAVQNETSHPVGPEDHAAAIADPAAWDPFARGEDDPYHSVTATPAGIEEYYRLGHAAADASDDA